MATPSRRRRACEVVVRRQSSGGRAAAVPEELGEIAVGGVGLERRRSPRR